MINPHDPSNLWKENFILAYGSETKSIVVSSGGWGRGEAWQQDAGTGGRGKDHISTHIQEAERAINGVRLKNCQSDPRPSARP